MKIFSQLPPAAALAAAIFFLVVAPNSPAQISAPTASANPAPPEELSQAELLKSYIQLRDQLQTTQLAITNNRLEAEATARAQALTIAEKLEAITAAMEAERERHRVELERSSDERERYRTEALHLNAERERQQAKTENSNHMVLLIASLFGGIGLISLLLTPLFQWRTLKRLSQLAETRPQLPAGAPQVLLSDNSVAAADQTVALSNQQLLLAIDRIERRIGDFEHTWATPSPQIPNGAPNIDSARPSLLAANQASANQAARISVLLAKGQSLLDSGKAVEALGCYNEILRLDLNHSEALVRRGAALERLKQDEEAIQCYDRAIKSDRKMTLAYLHKGAVCNRLERYEEAVKCYEQALVVEAEG